VSRSLQRRCKRSRWLHAGGLTLALVFCRERVGVCQEATLPPVTRSVWVAARPVSIETGTRGGQVWFSPVDGTRRRDQNRMSCASPCTLMLYPSLFDVIVDDPGRVRMHRDIVIDESTRRLSLKPRTDFGDAVTAAAFSVGPLMFLTGLAVGGLRGAGCEGHDASACSNRAMLSAWPIWGGGLLLTGLGVFSAITNRSTVEASP
jgi:hypothetical protein